jgi:formylglycine-generating enzyme required for sulfatase activity
MRCPYCQQEHAGNVKFCPATGKVLPQTQPQITCPKCARMISAEVVFCPHCGSALHRKKAARPVVFFSAALVVVALIAGLSWLAWGRDTSREVQRISVKSQEAAGAEAEVAIENMSSTVETPSHEGDGELPVVSEASSLAAFTAEAHSSLGQASPTPAHTSSPTPSPTPSPTDTPPPTSTPEPSITPTASPTPFAANPIDGAELAFIPAGEFLMGSDPGEDPYFYGSEGPPHMVYLADYWIYRTEVTNDMYRQCVEVKACPRPANNGSNTRAIYYPNPDFADYPVVYVSWVHAASYCRWAGGRLPTEAEWEKAARGTDGRLFPWGSEPPMPYHANYGTRDTERVGSYPEGASPYGVLDMAGNVIEWVRDYFQATYYQVSKYDNPLGPASGSTRVYRGGSYHNPAEAIRTVMRGSRAEDFANVDIGFRCVLEALR